MNDRIETKKRPHRVFCTKTAIISFYHSLYTALFRILCKQNLLARLQKFVMRKTKIKIKNQAKFKSYMDRKKNL